MEYTLSFLKNLDLSLFKKRIRYALKKDDIFKYRIFMPNHKIVIEGSSTVSINNNLHFVSVIIYDCVRNVDDIILNESKITIADDSRFNNFKDIFDYAQNYSDTFKSNDIEYTVDKLCAIITTVYKIDKLKAFL